MSLAQGVLDQRAMKGLKNARVSMTVSVDNGRDDQTFRYFRILTAKPIINLFYTTKAYRFTISDGSDLNTDGLRNRIDIVKIDRSAPSVESDISFDLVLDGTSLNDDQGQVYVFAVRASGPHIYQNPGDSGDPIHDHTPFDGPRVDVHAGNENDVDITDYPTQDRWLRSYVRDIDIDLVDVDVIDLRSKAGYKRGTFS